MQFAAPVSDEVPMRHMLQFVFPSPAACHPASQVKQKGDVSLSLNVPGLQGMHEGAPAKLHVPALHGMQTVVPASEVHPAVQFRQTGVPHDSAIVPG